MDHPHVGDAVASNCLLPFADLPDEYVGPSLQSYRMNDLYWAVPIDAACQVAAFRADRLAEAPRSYDDVFELARQGVRLGASLAGIHALMALLTLLAQMGQPVGAEVGDGLPNSRAVMEAADWLRRLQRLLIAPSLEWNPLDLFRAMALGQCDYAVFTFAYISAQKQNIRFAPVPSMDTGPSRGAVLGGTGLGVSAHSRHPEAAQAFARFVGSGEIQGSLWPQYGGQPAHRQSWQHLAQTDPFYRDLRPALEAAYVRPRFAGWNSLQSQAGNIINRWLRDASAPAARLDQQLRQCWNKGGLKR
jgi:multiple sugar transport system substrate-binding protein